MKRNLRTLLSKPTLEVAQGLIGCVLSTRVRGVRTSGMIVEVEAYCGESDEASHAYGGKRASNAAMFERPGTCYVYFIYGMHYCVNVVTEDVGVGAGVLIRALEPFEGIPAMCRRRGLEDIRNLTNGPAKLCDALAIDRRMLGQDLCASERIWLEPRRHFRPEAIGVSHRIGIRKSAALPWRFFLKESLCVSGSRGSSE